MRAADDKSEWGFAGPQKRVVLEIVLSCAVVASVVSQMPDPLLAQRLIGVVEACEHGEVLPVAGAIVRAVPGGSTMTALIRPWPASVETGSDGRFDLGEVRTGIWRVGAYKYGVGYSTVPALLERGGTTSVRLTLGGFGVEIRPQYAEVRVGQTLQLMSVVEPCGWVRRGLVVVRPRWQSDDAEVVTVSQDGLMTAVGVGSATILAESEGMTGSAAVTVTAGSSVSDRIVVQNNTVTSNSDDVEDETVVLVDARYEEAEEPGIPGCLADMVHGLDELEFDNLLARGTCGRDEIVAFSVDDAAVIDSGGTDGSVWTDAQGESVPMDLTEGLRTVPVTLWVAQGSWDGESVVEIAARELDSASTLYNKNRAGIRFEAVDTYDVSDDYGAVTAIGLTCSDLARANHFTPGHVNVYYVHHLSTGDKGVQCRSVDWNMIYVSMDTDNRTETTLAHELGHALGLEHVDPVLAGVWGPNAAYNIMCFGNLCGERRELTLGQVFRLNFYERSVAAVPGGSRMCECHLVPDDETPGPNECHFGDWFAEATGANGVCPPVSKQW